MHVLKMVVTSFQLSVALLLLVNIVWFQYSVSSFVVPSFNSLFIGQYFLSCLRNKDFLWGIKVVAR